MLADDGISPVRYASRSLRSGRRTTGTLAACQTQSDTDRNSENGVPTNYWLCPSRSLDQTLTYASLVGGVTLSLAAAAHQALHLSVMSRQGSGQFGTWRRQPGHPRKCWLEQVNTSTGLSPDAWSAATDRRALLPVDSQA